MQCMSGVIRHTRVQHGIEKSVFVNQVSSFKVNKYMLGWFAESPTPATTTDLCCVSGGRSFGARGL